MTMYLEVPHTSRVLRSRRHKFGVEEAGWQGHLIISRVHQHEKDSARALDPVLCHLDEVEVLLE